METPHYQISSQLGNRDSEIATVIEDTDLVPSRMNGVPVSVVARFMVIYFKQLNYGTLHLV